MRHSVLQAWEEDKSPRLYPLLFPFREPVETKSNAPGYLKNGTLGYLALSLSGQEPDFGENTQSCKA